MTDIVAFLNARLDEDEALAKLQAPWPWHVGDEPTEVFAEDGIEVATAFALSGNQQRNTAAFIARHDPARVLREVAAKRQELKRHVLITKLAFDQVDEPVSNGGYCDPCQVSDGFPCGDWPCDTLKLLAEPHATTPTTTRRGLATSQLDTLTSTEETRSSMAIVCHDSPAKRGASEQGLERRMTDTPDREQIVHDNPELAQQIREGVAEAERGETVYLGSFAQYLDEDKSEA